MGGVQNGARLRSHDGYDHPEWGIRVHRERRCHDSSSNGYNCTRPMSHPGQHISANMDYVVDTWPGEGQDPFAHVTAEAYAVDFPGWDNGVWGIRSADSGRWCRDTKEGHSNGAFCTRPVGHPGQHISTRGSNRHQVIWVKEVVPTAEEPEFLDPEDGSAPDPEENVLTAAPEVGEVVKLRDRVNRLYMLGSRANQPLVEVLDLTRNEFRTLPYSRLVKLDGAVLTAEELTQVTRWYAGHRQDVRRVAVREYRSGRWCRDGLNENLRALGLEEHQPTLNGQIRVTVPFECPDIHATQTVIEEKLREALAQSGVEEALRRLLPTVDGIELQSEQMSVSATNFNRS